MAVVIVEWQQLLQAVFIGLLFSYILAKIISTTISFSHYNHTLGSNTFHLEANKEVDGSMIAEKGSVRSSDDYTGDDLEDDWEGVESTELDEKFSAATAFVAAAAARSHPRVSDDTQLRLYGLYKIATEGPCLASQPSALKITARAKWLGVMSYGRTFDWFPCHRQSWRKLGVMPPEDAMQNYIDIVKEIYPSWETDSSKVTSNPPEGSIGPVLSTLVYEEESGILEIHDIHAFAREGEESNLLKCIENGISVDYKDSEGRSPLHWAVDRGHMNMVEVLLGRKVDVNSKDKEGQTPLHYAVMCEREGIAELLVKGHQAVTGVKDNDGVSPLDMCASGPKWPWMMH